MAIKQLLCGLFTVLQKRKKKVSAISLLAQQSKTQIKAWL